MTTFGCSERAGQGKRSPPPPLSATIASSPLLASGVLAVRSLYPVPPWALIQDPACVQIKAASQEIPFGLTFVSRHHLAAGKAVFCEDMIRRAARRCSASLACRAVSAALSVPSVSAAIAVYHAMQAAERCGAAHRRPPRGPPAAAVTRDGIDAADCNGSPRRRRPYDGGGCGGCVAATQSAWAAVRSMAAAAEASVVPP